MDITIYFAQIIWEIWILKRKVISLFYTPMYKYTTAYIHKIYKHKCSIWYALTLHMHSLYNRHCYSYIYIDMYVMSGRNLTVHWWNKRLHESHSLWKPLSLRDNKGRIRKQIRGKVKNSKAWQITVRRDSFLNLLMVLPLD